MATKHDLAQLEERLGLRIDSSSTVLRAELDSSSNALRAEFANQTRQIVLTLVPVIVAVNGMASRWPLAFAGGPCRR